MRSKKFNAHENIILCEIYRRLNYFHNGNLDASLLHLAYPNEVKFLVELGLIKPYSKETARILNWYNLTDKGKRFFQHYLTKLSKKDNDDLFNGVTYKTFDYSLIS